MPAHQQSEPSAQQPARSAQLSTGVSPSKKRRATASRRPRPVIGWREWARLPLLAPDAVRVKIDTGAATSSVHAHDLELFEVANDLDLDVTDGGVRIPGGESVTIARFSFRPSREADSPAYTAEAPITAFRNVKSSNGQSEIRPVIRTPIVLGDRQFDIDLTLADRDAMGYRMLLGRRAVRRRFLVDPGRSFLLAEPVVGDGDGDLAS